MATEFSVISAKIPPIYTLPLTEKQYDKQLLREPLWAWLTPTAHALLTEALDVASLDKSEDQFFVICDRNKSELLDRLAYIKRLVETTSLKNKVPVPLFDERLFDLKSRYIWQWGVAMKVWVIDTETSRAQSEQSPLD